MVARLLKREFEKKLRAYLEKRSLDMEWERS